MFIAALIAMLGISHTPASAAATSDQIACGTVNLGSSSNSDLATAFNCFTKAYSHCDLASLTADSMDAQGTRSSTFVIYPSDSGCDISETVSQADGPNDSFDAYVCQAVSLDGSALHFTGCGVQRDVWLKPANG
jgi:hypothetical protein